MKMRFFPKNHLFNKSQQVNMYVKVINRFSYKRIYYTLSTTLNQIVIRY